MKDFTTTSFLLLLNTFKYEGFTFETVSEYFSEKPIASRVVLLRHDVEDRYENALRFARIEHDLGIKGTYYFRFAAHSFNARAIHAIADMGHEIGYHYDDFSACKGNFEDAIKRFEIHLRLLGKIAPVQTICMEGDPLSKYDNRDLWKKYDYRDFGIKTEPYFDLDFNKVLYLTETGRRWDGHKFNVRDKIPGTDSLNHVISTRHDYHFHSTHEIVTAIEKGNFPKQVMMTFHPQRWNDNRYEWTKELVFQYLKNQVKYYLIKVRKWEDERLRMRD